MKNKIIPFLIGIIISTLSMSSTADPVGILTLGDSITYGISSLPTGPGFVELLDEMLDTNYTITNIGCGGAMASGWIPEAGPVQCLGYDYTEPIDYWDVLVIPNTPTEIVTIMLGTNDVVIGFPPYGYLSNLTKIINGLLDSGVETIILMTPPKNNGDNETIDTLLAGYADGIINPTTGLCNTIEGVICGPDVYSLLDPETDFAPNNAHPNMYGHQKIADALYTTIIALPEPSSLSMLIPGIGLLLFLKRKNDAS